MSRKLQTKKEIEEIIKILEDTYPDVKGGLDHETPLQLAVALILAAQCTDLVVNRTTPILFKKYPDVITLANADIEELKSIIRPCGFYITKAKNILKMANKLITNFGGLVPNTMEELLTLNGIGRKSANIILQECFNTYVGIAVDTHVSRTTKRMGFTISDVPLKQEQELIKKINKKHFNKINHILVYHGRALCRARKPKCNICPIENRCKKVGL